MRKTLLLITSILILNTSVAFQDTTREFTKAEQYYESGDYAMAERYYQQALVKYRTIDNLAAYIQNQLAFCLRYQKKTEDAAKAWRSLQSDYPNSPLTQEAQEHIARTYYEAGDYAKAAPEFEKIAAEAEGESVPSISISYPVGAESGEVNGKQVNAASALPGNKADQDEIKAAYGYAALCYSKSGKLLKAHSMNKKAKVKK